MFLAKSTQCLTFDSKNFYVKLSQWLITSLFWDMDRIWASLEITRDQTESGTHIL